MDVGFSSAGFEVCWANEINKNAAATYNSNFKNQIVCGDINDNLNYIAHLKGVSCVFGGPPCQGFSVAGKMDLNDPRSELVKTFMKVVELTSPECFVMENVKGLASLEKFAHFRQELYARAKKLGYACDLVILNARDFGVPQSRERMFFMGFRDHTSLKIRERLSSYRKREVTAKEALCNIGSIDPSANPLTCAAQITIATNPVLRKSPYAGMLFNGLGRPISPDRPAQTLPASMGGNKTPIIDERHFYGDGYSWIEDYHSNLMRGGQPCEKNGAPSSLRRLTLIEAKKLHSFPDDFVFNGPKSSIYCQIGNAVPCKLAEVVAKVANDIIRNIPCDNAEKGQFTLAI